MTQFKREAGVNPAWSRRCIGRYTFVADTTGNAREGWKYK